MGNETRIDDLLDRWEEAREQGQSISVEALCQDCPELQEELQGKIRELAWVNDAMATRAPDQVGEKKAFKIPRVLGRYRLEQLIGQGGFGQVWKAHDPELERVVAIKILRPERQGSVFQVANFLAEAKKVAKLSSHPNIVSVHDVGEDKGFCYMVSELIDGSNLARIIKSHQISVDEGLRIVAKVAEALHHGHENGIIHRDIKPQNILMDRFREPYVTDFGIAVTEAEIESDSTYAAGTPAYMAPEQAEPNASPLDRCCDIYSLGVVLYELLVGTTPYSGHSISDIRTAYVLTRPQPPKSLVSQLPDALDAVCMKALELDPNRRWNTAKEFADAILEVLSPPPPLLPQQPEKGTTSAFIFEEPAARTATRKARRTSQRRTQHLANVIMGGSALVVVVLLGILYGQMTGVFSVRPDIADNEANSGQNEGGVEPNSSTSSARSAGRAIEVGKDAGSEVLDPVPSVPPTQPTASTQIENSQPTEETRRPLGLAEEASNSADESTLPPAVARAGSEPLSSKPNGPITAAKPVIPESAIEKPAIPKDVAPKPVVPKRPEPPVSTSVSMLHAFRGLIDNVRCCQFSPDEKYVITAATAKPVRVWDADTGREVCRLDHDGRYAFFDGPNQIVTLGRRDKVCRWSFPDGNLLSTRNFRGCLTTGSHSQVRNLAIYVTKSSPSVFDLSKGTDVWTLPSRSNTFCVAMSNDGTLAVTGEQGGVARLWSVSTRREIREIARFSTYVQACAISPNKTLALVASWNNTTRVVNLNTGEQVRSHSRTMLPMSAAFSPDGRLYAVGCEGKILIWETATGRQVASISAHNNKYVESLCFSSDGSKLISGGRDRAAYLWRLPSL